MTETGHVAGPRATQPEVIRAAKGRLRARTDMHKPCSHADDEWDDEMVPAIVCFDLTTSEMRKPRRG